MKELNIDMISAEEMRKKQDEAITKSKDINFDENEVIELMSYINTSLQTVSNEYPNIKAIQVPKYILSKYSRASASYVAKMIQEKFKYTVDLRYSKDMAGTIQIMGIKW